MGQRRRPVSGLRPYPIFNPIEDFLFRLDIHWDGRDRIRELATRVPCNNTHWPDLFYRWFLNMVAHWRQTDRKYANCTVPLLVGPQAYRKSTFAEVYFHLNYRLIIPTALISAISGMPNFL